MFYVISKFLFSQLNSNSLRITLQLHVFVFVCLQRACPAVSKVVR